MVTLLGVLPSLSPYLLPSIDADSNRSTSVSPSGSAAHLPPASPSPPPEPEEEDVAKRAEKIKDQGNVAFKATKYAEAIDLYTKAIGSQTFLPFFDFVHPFTLESFHPNESFINLVSVFRNSFP